MKNAVSVLRRHGFEKKGKERQARRTRIRMENPRVRQALKEADEHNKSLDQLEVPPRVEKYDHDHSDVWIGSPPHYACCYARVPQKVIADKARAEALEAQRATRKIQKQTSVRAVADLPLEGEGNGQWTLGQARSMLRKGYTLEHAVRMTGWGSKWFSDIKLVDGRGVEHE